MPGPARPLHSADVRLPPDPIAFQLGPLPDRLVRHRLRDRARGRVLRPGPPGPQRAGEDPELVGNGMIIVAIAALIGGRAVPRHRPVARSTRTTRSRSSCRRTRAWRLRRDHHRHARRCWYTRCKQVPFWRWADIVAPGAVRDAGHRPLGQLLQPGAVRAADDPAVGHPDRLRPSDRRLPVRHVPGRDDPLPAAVPVRVALRGPRRVFLLWLGSRCRTRLATGRPAAGLLHLVRRRRGSSSRPCAADNWTFFGDPDGADRLGSRSCSLGDRRAHPSASRRADRRRPPTFPAKRRGARSVRPVDQDAIDDGSNVPNATTAPTTTTSTTMPTSVDDDVGDGAPTTDRADAGPRPPPPTTRRPTTEAPPRDDRPG